jgi:hypothetical protein
MPAAERDALTDALGAFADAAGEPESDAAIVTLLWPTTSSVGRRIKAKWMPYRNHFTMLVLGRSGGERSKARARTAPSPTVLEKTAWRFHITNSRS